MIRSRRHRHHGTPLVSTNVIIKSFYARHEFNFDLNSANRSSIWPITIYNLIEYKWKATYSSYKGQIFFPYDRHQFIYPILHRLINIQGNDSMLGKSLDCSESEAQSTRYTIDRPRLLFFLHLPSPTSSSRIVHRQPYWRKSRPAIARRGVSHETCGRPVNWIMGARLG